MNSRRGFLKNLVSAAATAARWVPSSYPAAFSTSTVAYSTSARDLAFYRRMYVKPLGSFRYSMVTSKVGDATSSGVKGLALAALGIGMFFGRYLYLAPLLALGSKGLTAGTQ